MHNKNKKQKIKKNLHNSLEKTEPIEKYLSDIKEEIAGISLHFSKQSQIDRVLVNLSVKENKYFITIDSSRRPEYLIYKDERRSIPTDARDGEPYEGMHTLQDAIGSIAYIVGLDYPNHAKAIDAIAKRYLNLPLPDERTFSEKVMQETPPKEQAGQSR